MPKATTSVTAATAVAPAYEEAMAELEGLVERMESGHKRSECDSPSFKS